MADVNNFQSFPYFPQLPKEVRLMIWEMELLGLRIVSVEMRSLRKTHLEWEREKEVSNKIAETPVTGKQCPKRLGLTTFDYERYAIDPPSIDGRLPGIKSNTPPPQLLLACNESFAVATKFYERVFPIHPSSPETYFNFYQDTSYIRHDTFNPGSTVPIEEWLIGLLCFFRGVERLSLVVQHYHKDNTASHLCLIEPIDVDAAWLNLQLFLSDPYKQEEIPVIPINDNMGLADVDLEVLGAGIEAEIGQDYVLPKIECGVIITRDFKEYLDFLLERCAFDPE